MSSDWGMLPLIALKEVLKYLNVTDAMAATSVCHHWRNGLLMYEAKKHTLKLSARHVERAAFLARVFKRHVRALYIHVGTGGPELDKFMTLVFPQFQHTTCLEELLFIGTSHSYLPNSKPVNLDRAIAEQLIMKHAHTLQRLGFMGCEMTVVTHHEDMSGEGMSSIPLDVPSLRLLDNTSLLHGNSGLMFANLRHIICEYSSVCGWVGWRARGGPARRLALTVSERGPLPLVDWAPLRPAFTVALVLISLPVRMLDEVIENVLVPDLPLVSLKVLFCKTIYVRLTGHVARTYGQCLREFVYADAPRRDQNRLIPFQHSSDRKMYALHQNGYNINPFIFLSWQCEMLERLVIHGYWMLQYDVLGCLRLRRSLRRLEASAVYRHPDRFTARADTHCAVRVLATDSIVMDHDEAFMRKWKSEAWSPVRWSALPLALRRRGSAAARREYLLHELTAV